MDECLRFCFLPVLRKELHMVAELWNTHNIQSQKRHDVEGGKPDIMYFIPEVYNTYNYLCVVDVEDVRACRRLYTENCADFHANTEELVLLLKPDYVPPTDTSEAVLLFTEIAQLLENY